MKAASSLPGWLGSTGDAGTSLQKLIWNLTGLFASESHDPHIVMSVIGPVLLHKKSSATMFGVVMLTSTPNVRSGG
jgi:hypothetical protein